MVKQIDGPTLKACLDANERMIIVDARAPKDYARGHLPGAVSLKLAEVEIRASDLLEKSASIVVYSNDADCPASGLVAVKLEELGYEPVYNYNPSYADWIARGYPVESD